MDVIARVAVCVWGIQGWSGGASRHFAREDTRLIYIPGKRQSDAGDSRVISPVFSNID